jgi:hypothetical protein
MTADTARRCGLTIGPLASVSVREVYDPAYERHDEARSGEPAAIHLADLYSSTAAASSLLVIAAFNSGEGAVVRRLQTLPDDQVRNWTSYNNQGRRRTSSCGCSPLP